MSTTAAELKVSALPGDELGAVLRHCSDDSDCSTTAGDPTCSRSACAFKGRPCAQTASPHAEPTLLREPRASETFIIFDWDDTLLPTSFIEEAARMCAPNCALPDLHGQAARYRRTPSKTLSRTKQRTQTTGLPPDFPCYAAIKHHATVVEQVLRAAKAAAHRVGIVTLSERPWVFESADKYLPGLDVAELLKELQIPVYYAPEHQHESNSEEEDPKVSMKMAAMAEFLQVGFGHDASSDGSLNVVSIGDSMVEKEAAEATVRSVELSKTQLSLCKTVKLISDPSLKQLTDDLQILSSKLQPIIGHPRDLDLHVQSPEDLTAQIATLSGA